MTNSVISGTISSEDVLNVHFQAFNSRKAIRKKRSFLPHYGLYAKHIRESNIEAI